MSSFMQTIWKVKLNAMHKNKFIVASKKVIMLLLNDIEHVKLLEKGKKWKFF